MQMLTFMALAIVAYSGELVNNGFPKGWYYYCKSSILMEYFLCSIWAMMDTTLFDWSLQHCMHLSDLYRMVLMHKMLQPAEI